MKANDPGVFTKVSTLTFQKKIPANPMIVASNVLDYLQKSYNQEDMDTILDNMKTRGWEFKEISHTIFDNMNDTVYDSKVEGEGLVLPSKTRTVVLQTIASYIKEEGRTLEEAKVARDLSKRIMETLSK